MPIYTAQLEANKKRTIVEKAIRIILDNRQWTPQPHGEVSFTYKDASGDEALVGKAIEELLTSAVVSAQWMLVKTPALAGAHSMPWSADLNDEDRINALMENVPDNLINPLDFVTTGGNMKTTTITANRHVLEGVGRLIATLHDMGVDVSPSAVR